jgi:DNA polymerase III delta prime subunit
LQDLQTYESKDIIEKALKEALKQETRPTNDARAAWEFSRVVKPGDVIIAKKGRKQYIGYGIVTGPYVYDDSRVTYRNKRPVKWVKKGEWNEYGGPIVLKTLTDITKYPEYVEKLKKLIGIDVQLPASSKPMSALNTIFYGPPGTGKTYTLLNVCMERFTESKCKYITFHQSYCYEDFVEGIKPVMPEEGSGLLSYEIKPGIFMNMVEMALNDPNHNYALLIDEINRGNIASIFGELIALIEDDKRKGAENELRVQLPYSRQEFVVPDNLYIIGAMNTADRSVEALDTALRRRFTFEAMSPQPEWIQQPVNFEVDLKSLLIMINGRIEKLLDKDHCIGHYYFTGIEKKDDPLKELRLIFKTRILPLLEEYFYGDAGKIGMVLGDRFVTRKDETIAWAKGDWGMNDFEERRVYVLKDPMILNTEDFRSVYV